MPYTSRIRRDVLNTACVNDPLAQPLVPSESDQRAKVNDVPRYSPR